MKRVVVLQLLVVCVVAVGCEGYLDFGIGCPRPCVCSNIETQQSAFVSDDINCPGGWVRGSINECTNTQTGKVELKLMSDTFECPEGYTGGAPHDYCELDPDEARQYNRELCIFHN